MTHLTATNSCHFTNYTKPVLIKSEFTGSNSIIAPSEVVRGTNIPTVWFDVEDLLLGFYVDDKNSVYDLVYYEDNTWYFSGFNSDLDLSSGKLYLVYQNEEKKIVPTTSGD